MRATVKIGGFTLVELVVVVTILGILAVFAVPRFTSLERQARLASRDALAGSVRSSAALVHALWLANGGEGARVTMEGEPIDVVNGYPAAAAIAGALADYTGYRFTAAGAEATFSSADLPSCAVTYIEATEGHAPVVRVTDPC